MPVPIVTANHEGEKLRTILRQPTWTSQIGTIVLILGYTDIVLGCWRCHSVCVFGKCCYLRHSSIGSRTADGKRL